MSAPPRSAMPAGASSSALGVWDELAPRGRPDPLDPRLRGRALRLRAPGGRASRASRPSVTWWPTARLGRRAVEEAQRRSRSSPCACRRGCEACRSPMPAVHLGVAGADGGVRRVRCARAWWWPPTARTRRCAPRPASARPSRTTTRWRWWRTWRPTARTRSAPTSASPPHGPLAVLPLHDGTLAVVWACTPANAQRAAATG